MKLQKEFPCPPNAALKHVSKEYTLEDCKNNIIKNNDNIEINTIFCNIKIEQFVSVFNNHQKLRISINHPENTYRYSFNMQ